MSSPNSVVRSQTAPSLLVDVARSRAAARARARPRRVSRRRALRRPGVEVDAEALQRRLDPGAHRLGREHLERVERRPGRRPRSASSVAELADVLARVAVLGRLVALHPRRDRLGEQPHLGAGVVDVVLALDLVAASLEQPRQRVAVGRAAGARRGHRAGRVGAHELDQDPLAPRRRRRPAPPAREQRRVASRCQRSERKTFRKPGPGDLDPLGARRPASSPSSSRRRSATSRGGAPAAGASSIAALVE